MSLPPPLLPSGRPPPRPKYDAAQPVNEPPPLPGHQRLEDTLSVTEEARQAGPKCLVTDNRILPPGAPAHVPSHEGSKEPLPAPGPATISPTSPPAIQGSAERPPAGVFTVEYVFGPIDERMPQGRRRRGQASPKARPAKLGSALSMKSAGIEPELSHQTVGGLSEAFYASFSFALSAARSRPVTKKDTLRQRLLTSRRKVSKGGGENFPLYISTSQMEPILPYATAPSNDASSLHSLGSPFSFAWTPETSFWSKLRKRESCTESRPAKTDPKSQSGELSSLSPVLPLESERSWNRRRWPDKNCRFLVLWGTQTCTSTPHLSKSAPSTSLEQLVDQLRASDEYVSTFGKHRGRVTAHVQIALDKSQVPLSAKLLAQSEKTQSPSSADRDREGTGNAADNGEKFEFRSLFSSALTNAGNAAVVSSAIPSPYALGGQNPSRGSQMNSAQKAASAHHATMSSVVEFEYEEDAFDFFQAATYTTATQAWGGRLWALPDDRGIKFWLHAILNSLQGWSHAALTLDQSVFGVDKQVYLPSRVWVPFLSMKDLQTSSLSSAASVSGNNQGVEIAMSSLDLLQLRTSPPLTVLTIPRLRSFCQSRMKATVVLTAEEMRSDSQANLTWIRIPRYIHKSYGLSTAITPCPSVKGTPIMAGEDAGEASSVEEVGGKREISSDVGTTPGQGDTTVPSGGPGSAVHAVRVGLLVLPSIITPVVLSSYTDFLHGCAPNILHTQSPASDANLPNAKRRRIIKTK